MCFAKPQSSTACQPRGQWTNGGAGSGGGVPAGRQRWRHFLFPVGKEKWRRLKEWGRNNLQGVEQTVQMVTMWVLNLNVTFALFALPFLFLVFLTILSSHRDIQAMVCGAALSIFMMFLLLRRNGWIDITEESSFRICAFSLLRKSDVSSLRSIESFGSTLSVRMKAYTILPLNHLSRGWGWLAGLELPPPFNYISVWLFATLLKCNRSEAEFECLTKYRTISHFFRRKLKPGARPLCSKSSVVSPADGTLTFAGPVTSRYLEQVKGIRYCLNKFLGDLDSISDMNKTFESIEKHEEIDLGDEPDFTDMLDVEGFDEIEIYTTDKSTNFKDFNSREKGAKLFSEIRDFPESYSGIAECSRKSDSVYSDQSLRSIFSDRDCYEILDRRESGDLEPELALLLKYPGNTALYQAVVYLRPSDYHRFHSPTTWTVVKRRHFPGKLYSVSPAIVRKMPGLFHTNERVSLLGTWQYGFFSMTAVGATNVGSIVINFDDDLATNAGGQAYSEKEYGRGGVQVAKGEEMGYFNFGSTIVLLFEAPLDFQFSRGGMSSIKVGEGI